VLEFAAPAAAPAADVTRDPGTTQRGMSADVGPDTAATIPVTPTAPANETAAVAVPGKRLAKLGPALDSPASLASFAVDSNVAAAVAADDRGRVEVANVSATLSSSTGRDSLGVTTRRFIAAIGRLPAVPYAGECVLADPTAAAGRSLAIGRCFAVATEVADTATAVKLAVGGRIAAATSIIETIICSIVTGARAVVGSLIRATAAATVRETEGGAVARAAANLSRNPGVPRRTVGRRTEGEIGRRPHKNQVALLSPSTSTAASASSSSSASTSSFSSS
jgi:hypothetical protein